MENGDSETDDDETHDEGDDTCRGGFETLEQHDSGNDGEECD